MYEEYFELLAQKISSLYNVDIDIAREVVSKSAIQEFVKQVPEYVGHISAYEWAKEVYEEMIVSGKVVYS